MGWGINLHPEIRLNIADNGVVTWDPPTASADEVLGYLRARLDAYRNAVARLEPAERIVAGFARKITGEWSFEHG